MVDAQDLQCVFLHLVRDNERSARKHQFPGSGNPANSPEIGMFAEVMNFAVYHIQCFISSQWIIRKDVIKDFD